jgi:hypothetical protein
MGHIYCRYYQHIEYEDGNFGLFKLLNTICAVGFA